MAPIPAASYWRAAIQSGFSVNTEWKTWANCEIETASSAQPWIILLSLANDRASALDAVQPQSEDEIATGASRRNIDDAVLGYYWLRLDRGDFDLQRCLTLSATHVDESDATVDPEAFVVLLNSLTLSPSVNALQVKTRARRLFEPFVQLAMSQWSTLYRRAGN
jgi:hypothetical protein